MKKVAILYSDYIPLIDAIKYQLSNVAEVDCYTEYNQNLSKYDLLLSCGYKGNIDFEFLTCHNSLLPAFTDEFPEKQAIEKGAKVTGITIFWGKSNRIVTQYPVFIYNDARYEELKQELDYLVQTILPYVAEKIIKNEQFEIQSFMRGSHKCSSSCRGCKGCK